MLDEIKITVGSLSTFTEFYNLQGIEINLLNLGDNNLSAYQEDLERAVNKTLFVLNDQIESFENKYNLKFTNRKHTAMITGFNSDLNVNGVYLQLKVTGVWENE